LPAGTCTITRTEAEEEASLMDQLVNPARCCPTCGSREYVFRGRKKIAADQEQPAAVETKYACKACGHAWKEKAPVKEAG
jgi:DNA-directed RNA polymerase subunit M/transcription elongation factor TFIIS